jgi:uncharacterized membrane protein
MCAFGLGLMVMMAMWIMAMVIMVIAIVVTGSKLKRGNISEGTRDGYIIQQL